MTPLAAKFVFLSSSAIGALTLGGTAYLVEHPQAFAPEPVRPIVTSIVASRPMPPAPVAVPEPIELEPMVVTGQKKPLITPARANRPMAKPPKTKELVPCTNWRDMGPTNIQKGDASGVRRVRTLC